MSRVGGMRGRDGREGCKEEMGGREVKKQVLTFRTLITLVEILVKMYNISEI